MIYAMVMISMGMAMIYAGEDTDLKILFAIGLLLYFAGILIGDMVEKRADMRIKVLEKEIEELKTNGKGNTL